MKNKLNLSLGILAISMLFAGNAVLASFSEKEMIQSDTLPYREYRGKVVDASSKDVLPFATVEAEGSNIATVTNIDGEFTLKIRKDSKVNALKFSYIGYDNKSIALSEFNGDKKITITMEPVTAQIREITIRTVNSPEFISEVLREVISNYNTEPQMMKGFYRETIKDRRNYVAISEAVVDIYKSGYKNSLQFDQVRIDRGRKSADVEKMDTVIVKLQGGPAVSLMLDVVKNPYILLSEEFAKIYDFKLDNVVLVDNRPHYVVGFAQKPYISEPYYFGKLFIDMDRLAISEAEFSLNVENKEEAARFFIEKKPVGMSIVPEKATYRSSYTLQDDKWYFNYSRAEVRFKVNWDKKLFNSNYTIMAEIAITDRMDLEAQKINTKERFRRSDVLDEMVFVFFEPEFWGDYNVIEPDQSIQSAIRKLNRKFDK